MMKVWPASEGEGASGGGDPLWSFPSHGRHGRRWKKAIPTGFWGGSGDRLVEVLGVLTKWLGQDDVGVLGDLQFTVSNSIFESSAKK
jgi:hypothetical protein